MKNRMPLFIISVISVGLLFLLLSFLGFVGSLKSYKKVNLSQQPHEIIFTQQDTTIKQDTIKLKRSITDISLLNFKDTNEIKMRDALTLNFRPKTLTYIFFQSVYIYISISIMIMLIIGFLIRNMIQEFKFKIKWKDLRWSLLGIVLLLVITGVLIAMSTNSSRLVGGATLMENFDIIFDEPGSITMFIIVIVAIVGIVCLFGIAFINLITNQVVNDTISKNKADQLKHLKGYLNSMAFFSSFIVAGAVIGTSLQREMIAEYLTNINLIYPNEFVAIYGMVFTFILAIFFVPTLVYIKYYERELEEEDKQNNAGEEKEELSWLHLGQEIVKEFKIVFAILLPFLISIIDYLIKLI